MSGDEIDVEYGYYDNGLDPDDFGAKIKEKQEIRVTFEDEKGIKRTKDIYLEFKPMGSCQRDNGWGDT